MRKLSLIGIKDSTPSCHVFRRSLRPSDIRECREQSEEIEDKDGLRRVVKTAKGQGPRNAERGSMMQGGMLSCIFLVEQEKNASKFPGCYMRVWRPLDSLPRPFDEYTRKDQREEVAIPAT